MLNVLSYLTQTLQHVVLLSAHPASQRASAVGPSAARMATVDVALQRTDWFEELSRPTNGITPQWDTNCTEHSKQLTGDDNAQFHRI